MDPSPATRGRTVACPECHARFRPTADETEALVQRAVGEKEIELRNRRASWRDGESQLVFGRVVQPRYGRDAAKRKTGSSWARLELIMSGDELIVAVDDESPLGLRGALVAAKGRVKTGDTDHYDILRATRIEQLRPPKPTGSRK